MGRRQNWRLLRRVGVATAAAGPRHRRRLGQGHRPPPHRRSRQRAPPLVEQLVAELLDFPRHLGIHSGGMVICDRPVVEVCPVEWARMPGRTVLEWNKDDCAAAGLVKFDLPGLGMLEALRHMVDFVAEFFGRHVDLGQLPQEDAVYDLLCWADTVGVDPPVMNCRPRGLDPQRILKTARGLGARIPLLGPTAGGCTPPAANNARPAGVCRGVLHTPAHDSPPTFGADLSTFGSVKPSKRRQDGMGSYRIWPTACHISIEKWRCLSRNGATLFAPCWLSLVGR